MRVSHGMREGAWVEITLIRQHVSQNAVRRDVKGHAESHVAAALVHLAIEPPSALRLLPRLIPVFADGIHAARCIRIADEELRKHVTRRQGHFRQVCRVPGAEDDPTVVGSVFELVDHSRKLVDASASIALLSTEILCAEMSPLEAIDGSEVAFGTMRESDAVEVGAGTIAVPDLDAGG